jgi:hypothetical protein
MVEFARALPTVVVGLLANRVDAPLSKQVLELKMLLTVKGVNGRLG